MYLKVNRVLGLQQSVPIVYGGQQPVQYQYVQQPAQYQAPVYYSQAPVLSQQGVVQQQQVPVQVQGSQQNIQSSQIGQSVVYGPSQVSYGEPIKGETKIEYIPYQKYVTEYEEQVYYEQIPKQKKVREYYAVEYVTEYQPVSRIEQQVEYVPQTITEKVPVQKLEYIEKTYTEYVPKVTTEYVPQEKVEYIPVQKTYEKIEYQPVQKSFVRQAPEKASEVLGYEQVSASQQVVQQPQQSQVYYSYVHPGSVYQQGGQPWAYQSGVQPVVAQGQQVVQKKASRKSSSSD